MQDYIAHLASLDEELKKTLLSPDSGGAQVVVKKILEDVAKRAGRVAKLHATYLFERMADIVHDMEDAGDVTSSVAAVMFRWIDSGLSHAAFMVNPDSVGRYLESFDQIVVPVTVPLLKDPEDVRRRKEMATTLQDRFEEALNKKPAIREPKITGNIIIPGS